MKQRQTQAQHCSGLLGDCGAGCLVVKSHPKYSPDLNAIEGWWRVLRERLEQAAPEELESREAFIARLRRTVN